MQSPFFCQFLKVTATSHQSDNNDSMTFPMNESFFSSHLDGKIDITPLEKASSPKSLCACASERAFQGIHVFAQKLVGHTNPSEIPLKRYVDATSPLNVHRGTAMTTTTQKSICADGLHRFCAPGPSFSCFLLHLGIVQSSTLLIPSLGKGKPSPDPLLRGTGKPPLEAIASRLEAMVASKRSVWRRNSLLVDESGQIDSI